MSSRWYVRIDARELGPLSSAELKALSAQGEVVPATPLKQGSDGLWVTAAKVKGLFESGNGGLSSGSSMATARSRDTASLRSGDTSRPAAGEAVAAADERANTSDMVRVERHGVREDAPTQDYRPSFVAVIRELTPGSALGPYRIVEAIGRGSMGLVFKATHLAMDRDVAIKILPPSAVEQEDAVRRFRNEVRAAARLNHPNIVTAYDAGECDGVHFLVMEYVDGQDLAAIVEARGPLKVSDALDYVLQAARGLEYAHGEGIVHRDVKPSNLLVDKRGRLKILDMGLARFDEKVRAILDATLADPLTWAGQTIGTLDYMAPEQAEDARKVDHRADIYSLGCTMYKLLTGRPMYEADSPINKIVAHRTQPIPALRKSRPEVSPEACAVFRKMVAKQSFQRYQDFAELIRDLETCREPAGRVRASHVVFDARYADDNVLGGEAEPGSSGSGSLLRAGASVIIAPASDTSDAYHVSPLAEEHAADVAKPPPSDLLTSLVLHLADANEDLRSKARAGLKRMGKSAVPRLIDVLAADARTSQAAASILVDFGKEAVLALVAALGHADKRIRQAAVWVLGKIGAPAAVELAATLDGDEKHRNGAIVALGRIGPSAKPALKRLRKLEADGSLSPAVHRAVLDAIHNIAAPAKRPK